ncbi:MAG TPA: IPExxxVDY family protein [Chitinophagaceae bacterium]
MIRYKLNTEELTDDFFEETRLFGITAPLRNYHFCWLLNRTSGYDFRLNPDIEIQLRKKERNYFFSIYEYSEPASGLTHYIYHNHFDGEYLLPEFRHMDFLWLMKGNVYDEEKCDWILQTVRGIGGVQLVAELTNEKIKNKGNMIF